MGKKVIVRLSEQELADLLTKYILGGDEKPSTNQKTDVSGDFVSVDLNTPEGYRAYSEIADKFIATRPSNLLGLRGSMFADAAKKTFNQYKKFVPVELAMGQLAAEGGFSKNPNARPIRTKNPFNVGNIDTGKNVSHSSVQTAIQSYYDLIAKNYLTGGKTASDLIQNFVNKGGKRYATNNEYENIVSKISNQVKNISQPIYASLSKKMGDDIA